MGSLVAVNLFLVVITTQVLTARPSLLAVLTVAVLTVAVLTVGPLAVPTLTVAVLTAATLTANCPAPVAAV